MRRSRQPQRTGKPVMARSKPLLGGKVEKKRSMMSMLQICSTLRDPNHSRRRALHEFVFEFDFSDCIYGTQYIYTFRSAIKCHPCPRLNSMILLDTYSFSPLCAHTRLAQSGIPVVSTSAPMSAATCSGLLARALHTARSSDRGPESWPSFGPWWLSVLLLLQFPTPFADF